MAGEYADLTLDEVLSRGTEADSGFLHDQDARLSVAKDQLRRDAHPVLGPMIGRFGTDETTFYDAVAALPATEEVRGELDQLILWEVYVAYYGDGSHRAGAGNTAEMRRKQYQGLIRSALPRFRDMVQVAYDQGELTFTGADRSRKEVGIYPFI